MLVVVLLLVVAAGGVLGFAMNSDTPESAWISVLLTGIGGFLLLVESRRRRAERSAEARVEASTPGSLSDTANTNVLAASVRQTDSTGSGTGVAPASYRDSAERGSEATGVPPRNSPRSSVADQPDLGFGAGVSDHEADEFGSGSSNSGGAAIGVDEDPVAENSWVGVRTEDELAAEVVVVDERPRYHLEDCGWLAVRIAVPTIPISVGEAGELGFSPCAHCEPTTRLAERYRGGNIRADGSTGHRANRVGSEGRRAR